MKNSFFIIFSFLCLAASYAECHGGGLHEHVPLWQLLRNTKLSLNQYNLQTENLESSKKYLPVFVGPQDGQKEANKIDKLPGQPDVKFDQYSGHVMVDPEAGRALFYYFAEAVNPADKPLVLWLNGGPGCSSMGIGAMMELGPFRVKPGGKTLSCNQYAWNNVANVLFLESPAGVGFSYSNRSSDYNTGDDKTAADSYTFLLNWFERFPEYKKRDFFIAGESYAGHYIPQLTELILSKNKNTNYTVIKLKGIALGNALLDYKDFLAGRFNYWWTHALISDETHKGIVKHCKYSSDDNINCTKFIDIAFTEIGNIDGYDIYAPLCLNSSSATTPSGMSSSSFDPCSEDYVYTYLNRNKVQKALHVADVAGITRPWDFCSEPVRNNWTDFSRTVIPVVKKLMRSGIRIWIYSGDTDAALPVTATKYSLHKLKAGVKTAWYPWYNLGEVGGYAVVYDHNLMFATVRGSGHMVPSSQPGRALALFTSFLRAKSPPLEN